MSNEQFLISAHRNIHPEHPLREELHDWHWRFRLGETQPSEASILVAKLTASTWTPQQEIERLKREVIALRQQVGQE